MGLKEKKVLQRLEHFYNPLSQEQLMITVMRLVWMVWLLGVQGGGKLDQGNIVIECEGSFSGIFLQVTLKPCTNL